jgi:hypothetical protein
MSTFPPIADYGFFPQAFTHLALIEAVSRLIESEQVPNRGASSTPRLS